MENEQRLEVIVIKISLSAIFVMMEIVFLFVGLLVGSLAAWFIASTGAKSGMAAIEERIRIADSMQQENQDLLQELRAKNEQLSSSLAVVETEKLGLTEKLEVQKANLEQLQEKFTKDFQIIANKIMEEKSSKFVDQNKLQLGELLNPLKERIKDFEQKVEENQKQSIDRHAALRQHLFHLKELNQQMSDDAKNLTKALKGESKTQGNWGEIILERVLEQSGLEKGREYHVQQSFTTADGRRLQPDVVISLPDAKSIVIDSKVSLVAYDEFVKEDDQEKQKRLLTNHIISVRNHIKQLAEKQYQTIYDLHSLDFVFLFIPIEPAFNLAVQQSPELWEEAYSKNIVIISTSTLFATLKTISSIWNTEKANQNATLIANKAGDLYDKFYGFTEDLVTLGKQLNTVKGTYDSSMKKLSEGRGNLVKRIEDFRALGINPKNQLNPKLIERSSHDE